MGGDRVAVESTGALPLDDVRDAACATRRHHALASRDDAPVAVLVWNYHDDDLPAPAANVELTIAGLPDGQRRSSTHYRVDGDHSNAYAAWKRMGSPQPPTPAQYAQAGKGRATAGDSPVA